LCSIIPSGTFDNVSSVFAGRQTAAGERRQSEAADGGKFYSPVTKFVYGWGCLKLGGMAQTILFKLLFFTSVLEVSNNIPLTDFAFHKGAATLCKDM
jgi:hypothetical protein